MDRLAFNAVAAITHQAVSRQVTANELANVSTPGFKRSYDVALRGIKAEGAGMETRIQPQAMSTDRIKLRPGPFMATGRDLDIALNEQAVMGVQTADGKLAFTRRGDLRINAQGVLENGAGHPVRSENGGTMTVPTGAEIRIAPDGSLFAKDPNQANAPDALVGRLLLRDASQVSLERREDGLFQVEGAAPGADITNGNTPPSLTAKALEGSNVNAMEVMIKLMDQARSFEQQVRIIKESKSGDEAGASMLKLGN